MQFQKEIYEQKFKELLEQKQIVKSNASFKINLFFKKAESSYLIAHFLKKQKENPEQLYWWQWTITYKLLFDALCGEISNSSKRIRSKNS